MYLLLKETPNVAEKCLPLRIKMNLPELYATNFNQSIPLHLYPKKMKERLSLMSRFKNRLLMFCE
jgi:hypothetical protein